MLGTFECCREAKPLHRDRDLGPVCTECGVVPHKGLIVAIGMDVGQFVNTQWVAMALNPATVEAWPLSHGAGYPSTAFLLAADGAYALYLGDTGPDPVEKSQALATLWDRIAPLIRVHRLRGVFLEASYPDGRPDAQLFGHLTPSWVLRELHDLAVRVDPAAPDRALQGLPVVVTHIKPTLQAGPNPRELIRRQLQAQNDLGVAFILPEQGQAIRL